MKLFDRDYSQTKQYRTAGTHRSRPPAETLAELSRHAPELGITRLANVTGLDRIGIPVYMAIRPNARSVAVSQGKGPDPDQAKASALMESLESWHAERIELPARMASYWEMCASVPTVDIFQLPLRPGGTVQPDVPVPWIRGYDLLLERPTWVPYEVVTMNTLLSHVMKLTYDNGSTGLASGNHLLEAVLHGLLEVVERDALAVWERTPEKRRLRRKVSLSSIADPEAARLLGLFERAEVAAAVWDLTTSLGLSTYACAIGESKAQSSWRCLGVFRGFGCHLSPEVALNRALCEAAQSRLTIISGSRDDNPRSAYENSSRRDRVAAEHSAFFRNAGTLPFGTRRDISTPSFEQDIALVLDALRDARIESAIVVDLTLDRLSVPVVKVIIPGLADGLGAPQDRTGGSSELSSGEILP